MCTREFKLVEKKRFRAIGEKLKQGLLIFDDCREIYNCWGALMYRRVTAVFEIVVKIGKDFLTNCHFGQKHAILEKSRCVQVLLNYNF